MINRDTLLAKKWYFLVSLCVVILDQGTKYLIVQKLRFQEIIPVASVLDIVYFRNTGSAFGMFQTLGNTIFVVLSLVAMVVIWVMLVLVKHDLLALSLFLGGAAGNVIDRMVSGSVVDFISVHAGKYYWPAFNVADSALTVGIVLLLLGQVRKGKNEEER